MKMSHCGAYFLPSGAQMRECKRRGLGWLVFLELPIEGWTKY
jgi:hypothetical protein